MNFLENNHFLQAQEVSEDKYDTLQHTKCVAVTNYDHVLFVNEHGTGTGTATITAEVCDDASGTNPVAIPFRYRTMSSTDTSDTWSAYTEVTAAGFTTPAANNQLHAIEIDSREVLAANPGVDKPFVRLTFTEVVNSPVTGSCVAVLSRPRYAQSVPTSALAA